MGVGDEAGRRVDGEAVWRRRLQRHRQSGKTIKDFCLAEKVSQPTFFAWRKRLGERQAESISDNGAGFVSVGALKVGAAEAGNVRELRIELGGVVITIRGA